MDEQIRAVAAPRRHWFHLPSLAVIAAATAATLIAYKGFDAWHPRHDYRPEPRTIAFLGHGVLPHIEPDTITWTATVDVTAPHRADAERALREKTSLVLQAVHEAAGDEPEIRSPGLHVEEVTDDAASGFGFSGARRVTGYHAYAEIDVYSTKVDAVHAAYRTLEAHADTSLELTSPKCGLLDDTPARRRAEQAAWADLRRQLTDARDNAGLALGRIVNFENGRGTVAGDDSAWNCNTGFTAGATISATYELK
jgi:uncharacterized protein YggE